MVYGIACNQSPSFGNAHAKVAETAENMAVVYRRMGELEKALEIYKRVLEQKRSTYGHLAKKEMIGNVLHQKGDLKNALLRHRKALAIQEVALGPSHDVLQGFLF